MRKLLLILCFSILAGCATEPQILKGSGQEVFAPAQWQILCYEKPWLEICKPL